MVSENIWLGVISEEKEALEHLDIWKFSKRERIKDTENEGSVTERENQERDFLMEDLSDPSLPLSCIYGGNKHKLQKKWEFLSNASPYK